MSFDYGNRYDSYDRGYQARGRSRSPSPTGQKAWGGNQVKDQGWSRGRSRSRSPEKINKGQPGKSFHEMMMEKTRSSPMFPQKTPAADYGNGQSAWGKSNDEEEEEGAIPS